MATSEVACAKCKVTFEPGPEILKKMKRGHVPMCPDCFSSTYGGLPHPAFDSKAAHVDQRLQAGIPHKDARLMACADCKKEWSEHLLALGKATRARCPGCGSLKIEPKSNDTKFEATDRKRYSRNMRDVRGGIKFPWDEKEKK